MRRLDRPARRPLRPGRSVRPDTVLLRRELRWTSAAVLGLGAAGFAVGDTYGAAIGTGAGYLLQQMGYRFAVQVLWEGWCIRAVTRDGAERAHELGEISLRAFTLWMRTARMYERVHVARWYTATYTAKGEIENDPANCTGSKAEIRILNAYLRAAYLDNEPLRCDNLERRRLRHSLQRDETRLLHMATERHLEERPSGILRGNHARRTSR